eukprot:340745-Prymnesium_polylepis.1
MPYCAVSQRASAVHQRQERDCVQIPRHRQDLGWSQADAGYGATPAAQQGHRRGLGIFMTSRLKQKNNRTKLTEETTRMTEHKRRPGIATAG